MEPFLVFRRTGRAIAAVVAFGFGGGTVIMGVATSLASAMRLGAFLPAFTGYFLAASPFFLFGWILSRCRRELWFVPEASAFRMLTYRPWLLKGPRVEQASLDDYRAVTTRVISPVAEEDSTLVALLTQDGDAVPVDEPSFSTLKSRFQGGER